MAYPTQLPDTLDSDALSLVYDAWKTKDYTDPKLALACWNVAGFGLYKTVGQAPKPLTAEDIDAESAFQMLLSVADDSTKQGIDWVSLFKTILPIVISIIGVL